MSLKPITMKNPSTTVGHSMSFTSSSDLLNYSAGGRSATSNGSATLPSSNQSQAPKFSKVEDEEEWSRQTKTEERAPGHHFERALDNIAAAAEKDEMAAYGSSRDKVFGQIDQIRKRQIDIFRRQMKLEVGLSMDDNEEEHKGVFMEDGFSEKFQEKFKKKEKALDSIRTLLENLTTQVKEVNDLSTDLKMPSNPGFIDNEAHTANSQGSKTGDNWKL